MIRVFLPSHVELPPAASSAGHLFHKKAFKTTVGRKEKRLSLKPFCRRRLKVHHKKAAEVGSRTRPCGASTLDPLPSSVRANMSRAHAP